MTSCTWPKIEEGLEEGLACVPPFTRVPVPMVHRARAYVCLLVLGASESSYAYVQRAAGSLEAVRNARLSLNAFLLNRRDYVLTNFSITFIQLVFT